MSTLVRRPLSVAALAVAALFLADLRPVATTTDAGPALALAVAPAAAQSIRAQSRRVSRRTARRTSRRTTARHNAYINTLPGGCVLRAGYHYCGGVYYQPVVQSGATVYVVVNP
ncbi:MAG: hypothetical protein AAFZ09_06575 [Pseudomonadota bacterium]